MELTARRTESSGVKGDCPSWIASLDGGSPIEILPVSAIEMIVSLCLLREDSWPRLTSTKSRQYLVTGSTKKFCVCFSTRVGHTNGEIELLVKRSFHPHCTQRCQWKTDENAGTLLIRHLRKSSYCHELSNAWRCNSLLLRTKKDTRSHVFCVVREIPWYGAQKRKQSCSLINFDCEPNTASNPSQQESHTRLLNSLAELSTITH